MLEKGLKRRRHYRFTTVPIKPSSKQKLWNSCFPLEDLCSSRSKEGKWQNWSLLPKEKRLNLPHRCWDKGLNDSGCESGIKLINVDSLIQHSILNS